MRLVWGVLDRICVVIGALLFAQIPLFMQSYTQRLAGHAEELSTQVEQLRQVAMLGNKTLEQYIGKFLQSNDPDFSHQGQWMQRLVDRWEYLSTAYTSLQEASPWSRPLEFFHYFDSQIAKPTFEQFEPGLPFTLEGGAYALVGVVVGFFLFRLLLRALLSVRYLFKPFQKNIPSKSSV